MGFSTVAATAILGGSIVLSLTIFSGSVLPTMSEYHDSFRELEQRSIARLQTNINITNITNTSGLFYDLNITVRNIGSTTLKTSDFTFLINGTKQSYNISANYIFPENEEIFTLNLTGTGLKQIKVVTENGISIYEEYIV